MKLKKSGLLVSIVLFVLLVTASDCGTKKPCAVPPDGTKVTTNSEVFRQTAKGLQERCERSGGCTCYMDGVRTTCSLVFACLDSGMCELAAE